MRESARVLSGKIFTEDLLNNQESLTEKEKSELCDFLHAGTYGTVEKFTENKLKKFRSGQGEVTLWRKIRYCLSRLFPGREWCRLYCPFFDRHPYLLPFFWGYRLVWAVFFQRDRVKAEIGAVRKL